MPLLKGIRAMMHGKGVMTFANGEKYCGEWENDMMRWV